MEKLRSFPWKSTKFLVLSLTLSFSLVLLSFFSFWALHAKFPAIYPKSYLLFNTPSLSLNLNLQSWAGSFNDSSAFTVNNTNLSNTHFTKLSNCSGFVSTSCNRSSIGTRRFSDQVLVDREEVNTVTGGSRTNVVGNDVEDFPDLSTNSSVFVASPLVEPQEVEKLSSDVKNDENRGGYHQSRQESEPNSTSIGKSDNGIEEKGVKDCDVSKGRWVFDESYPLYTNLSCPFIDEGFNCQGNGRMDNDYMKWRWQPQDCDIPRFNATNMLELIRGKRVVFAGDSINRNQWESLLCLLIGAVKDPKKVYETHGRRITKEKGSYSFRFVDYQCTVEFYVTHFLVHESKMRMGRKRKGTLRIDTVDKGSSRWKGADILIFNTGNWWSHYKTKAGNNYYQEGKQLYPHLDALTAYRKALMTWATWVDRYVNPRKTLVFFRSTAPAHFRGGEWNNGGHCREARTPLREMYIDNPEKDLIAEEVMKTMKTPVTFLNVTGLSSYRIDGHPSKYGRNPAKGVSLVQDCSHWCLPGVPDAWNELIYHQLLLKH